MTVSKPRLSNNSITVDAPITLYSNSPELNALNPNFVRVIPGNVVSAIVKSYEASTGLSDGSEENITVELLPEDDTSGSDNGTDGSTIDTQPIVAVSPRLSDISILSSTIVYDSAGNPSVTVVFKVKNTGTALIKGVNARVQAI